VVTVVRDVAKNSPEREQVQWQVLMVDIPVVKTEVAVDPKVVADTAVVAETAKTKVNRDRKGKDQAGLTLCTLTSPMER